jgi:hypothetical protein
MVVEMGSGAKGIPITGSPYSGIGTTETVQVLADGNRIVHTNTTHYFRDSKGRTRTEYTLSAVGPFTLDESRKLVLIDDPASGQRYILHPELKRAESLPAAARVAIGSPNGSGPVMTMSAVTRAGGAVLAGSSACNADPIPAACPGLARPEDDRGVEGNRHTAGAHDPGRGDRQRAVDYRQLRAVGKR